ncbi:protoporphyrinogen/coproporphyrinogen oxidase [Streptomyces inhibens]|uniref:protoporphyrinogen/coproporphyrinogen oxidase n=1 Tax=Streptomyces inhibens TaxID=2293571 RepID=UPI0036BC1348
MPRSRVIVIGAGIAGLTAASTLRRRGCEVTVLERAERAGGRITTVHLEGQPIDVGAEYVTNAHTHTIALLRRFGLAEHLQPVPLDIALLDGGPPQRLSLPKFFAGRHLGPSAQVGLARAYLTVLRHWPELSFADMARAHRLDTGTTASLFPSWGGNAVQGLIHPMMRAFLFTDPHHTSRATMLAYLKLLLTLRSVRTLTGGLQRLPQHLAATVEVRLGHTAIDVTQDRQAHESTPGSLYEVHVTSPKGAYKLDADAVVCATTAPAAAQILTPLPASARNTLTTIRYASAAVLNCALQQRISSPARWVINMARTDQAVAIMRIIPGGAERTGDILTLWSPGGAIGAELCQLPDDQVLRRMTEQARTASPDFALGEDIRSFRVDRWNEALPEFPVGHLRRLQQLTAQLPHGLALAGDYLAGQNLEAAITSGIRAADRATAHLQQRHGPLP